MEHPFPSSSASACESLASDLRARFERGEVALPLLSASVQRVLSAASDARADARALADIIKQDQAFAGHVLRIANSALYGAPSPIVSLQQAVSRLGMGRVREVALLISTQTRVFAVRGFAAELKAQFQHAIAAAMFAQEVARSRRKNVEEAFLGGLLHDVGRPIVLQAILDASGPAASAVRDHKPSVWALIDDLHALAGKALAQAWSLPQVVADMIARHHDASATQPTVHIIQLADALAHVALADAATDEAHVRSHPVLDPLNLYPEDVDRLLARREAIASAAGAFA